MEPEIRMLRRERWPQLHGNEKTPPVDDISKSSRRKCNKNIGTGRRDLNERNQEWIGRQSGQRASRPRRSASTRRRWNDGCEPQHGEGRVAEGRQRRTCRPQALPCRCSKKPEEAAIAAPHWPGVSLRLTHVQPRHRREAADQTEMLEKLVLHALQPRPRAPTTPRMATSTNPAMIARCSRNVLSSRGRARSRRASRTDAPSRSRAP
mgnify:CR=1 FL=1